MRQFSHFSQRRKTRLLNLSPASIEGPFVGRSGVWIYEDGAKHPAECISCVDQPCRLMGKSESTVEALLGFAADTNSEVCPVGAIGWDSVAEQPVVEANMCIACGLCIAKCPAGAMGLDSDGIAYVAPRNKMSRRTQEVSFRDEETVSRHRAQVKMLPKVRWDVPYFSDSHARVVSKRAATLTETSQIRIVRSALVCIFASAAVRRRGDVHTRADGFYGLRDGTMGSLEVEFGTDSLEAVRATLDDLAVANARYGLPVDASFPLVVMNSLPRERQGYWQVVSDVENVLGIEIFTATLGALLLLVWNQRPLTAELLVKLNPRFDMTSIRGAMEVELGRPIDIKYGAGGILEPEK